jgi:CRISPR/Cas system-associated exonuclease Cas4 (RecB family)
MNPTILPPGANLIETVISYLIGRGALLLPDRDYSSSLVIFPGKRPSHFLRDALAKKIGTSFIPPVTFSIDAFIDFIYEKFGLLKNLETIDAVALLYEIHQSAPKHLGGTQFLTPDSFFPLGMKIYHDIEEMTIEGVSSQRLQGMEAVLSDGIPRYTEERLQSLSYFYKAFYERATSLGFSTRSQRYQVASQQVDQSKLEQYDRIIFAGFFALTYTEKIIFKKLLSCENTCFLFQPGVGLAENLILLGIVAEEPKPATKPTSAPRVHFYSSSDTHGQVLALGALINQYPLDKESVIMLPTPDTLFPLIRQGLSDMDEDSYNVSMGYPLSRTPVFGFLNNLMGLITSMDGDRVYIPDYLKFVLHPYTKNIFFQRNSEITRILFHTLEDELQRQKAKTFTTLEEIEESKTLFVNVEKKVNEQEATKERLKAHLTEIHRITIGKFLSFENVAEFATRCIDLLVFLFHQSPAKRHPLFHPFSESLITALSILPRSLMKGVAFSDRATYFVFLRKYIATCHTPFSGTPIRGLQVLGSLETRNLTFKNVFVLDANEEILPETKKEESLIPFRAREILGLPTYIDKDKRTAYHFDTLIHHATDVHLFFIENDKKERSRFVEKLLWERQKKDLTHDARRDIKPISYRVNLGNEGPAPIDKTSAVALFLKDFTFSATALDSYLKCPLKFYYKSVLGLKPKQDVSGDIERSDLGSFVHAVLRDYFLEKKGRKLLEADMDRAQMDALVDDLFTKQYGGDSSSGALYILKRQVKRHLGEFLTEYCLPLVNENRVTVLSCEEAIDVRVNGFRLKGRIDKVERRNDKMFIVDYKTGATPAYVAIDLKKLSISERGSWQKAIGSLQLPFYILLYSEKTKTRIADMEALFLFLGRFKMGKEIEQPLWNGADPDAVYAPLKTVILKLLAEITDPAVSFRPTEDQKGTCPGCDYKTICGTQWRG